ncbi:hypothetical protein, partial [uncultured Victivallis sp.]|uniref:hypothetical protein n=1 Tax=uncultured Victivallis sp. TaxID=354118 RepID=UPI002584D359
MKSGSGRQRNAMFRYYRRFTTIMFFTRPQPLPNIRVFLKPEESNAYLELYATPSGNKSALQTGADRSQTGSAGGSLRAGGQKAGQAGVVRTYRQAEFLNISM